VVLLACLALDLVLVLLLPGITQRFIDDALAGALLPTLLTGGAAYLATALLVNAVGLTWIYLATDVGLIATNRIRADLTRHCLSLDMTFHNSRTPGEMIERVDGDVGQLMNFLSRLFFEVLRSGLLMLGAVIMLMRVDWRASLPMIAALIIAIATRQLLAKPSTRLNMAERQASAELYGFIEERLTGTEDIRANGASAYVLTRHAAYSRTFIIAHLKASLIELLNWRTSSTVIELAAVASLSIAALQLLDGELTLGAVYAVFAYATLVQEPMHTLVRELSNIQPAIASINRIQSFFDERSALTRRNVVTIASPRNAPLQITFKDVHFAYPGDEKVLHSVSFEVPAGSTLGVIGRTGSGKTTLTRLLLRLYDVDTGTLRIGGIDARHTTNDDLRARTAVVTQDVQLFNASVRDNLTLFDAAISDARVREAVAAVGMHSWLDALPEGLDTLLSGSGGLSAGEAQLLAFARAFLRDPGLVLLDEASSRLDPATERKLDDAVDLLLRNRTGVIVAHRLSTLDRVDSILILEDGRVREFGPRAALAAEPGSRYSQLLAAGIEEALA
jgi:ABC-type multidrug transport system fused ATPase/permease subunit